VDCACGRHAEWTWNYGSNVPSAERQRRWPSVVAARIIYRYSGEMCCGFSRVCLVTASVATLLRIRLIDEFWSASFGGDSAMGLSGFVQDRHCQDAP